MRRALAATCVLVGLISLFISVMSLSGAMPMLLADRWQFFVQDMGVTDKALAYRISERLADDASRKNLPSSVLTFASGLLLVAAGIALGKRSANLKLVTDRAEKGS